MRISYWTGFALFSVAALLPSGCTTTGNNDITGEVADDGLVQLNVDTFETVAVHAGADLATFSKIFIEPAALEFREGWQPAATGSRLTASQAELEDARNELEALFMKEFTDGLSSNTRLEIVEEPAPRVLRVTPRLTDVTISTLGDTLSAGQAFSRKQGQVRLELSIHDVRTGILVARIEDMRVLDNESNSFFATAANTNRRFGDIFNAWGEFVGTAILNISPEPQ